MSLGDDGRAAGPAREGGDPALPGAGTLLAGRYLLGAQLGSGGMGRVHAAQDRKLEREVAVKLLVSAAPDGDVLRRFEREALAAGSLQHPNIVAVFDAGEENGRPFLVTELLRGTTLRERLAQGPLPETEAQRIARQMAAGLTAAHEKGLTHRDLKPENIFITNDGWVKILDFGLVKLTETLRSSEDPPASDDASTGAGRVLGTVGYMAPEQVRGRPVDPRADIFNFGLVLYEMLCGQRAFRAGSPTETGYATLFRQPAPLPRSVRPHLRALVAKCLEKDPVERVASARELLGALDAHPEAGPRLPWPRIPWRALAAAAAAAAALALAATAFLIGRRHRGELPAAAPPAGTVAILPFSARDAPHFAWLSEGVVDLLARDLSGSELRAVDSASVLRAVGGDTTADIDKVRGASAQLGAKYFVLGRIEERRGQLVLEAVLHTGDAGVPVAEALAQGDPADMLRLVRKLSDQLQLRSPAPQEFEARLGSLARRTSRSLPALQAWLQGEQLLRRGHWDEVVGLFQRAVAADPSFALAQYHLAMVAEKAEPGLAEDALQRALLNSDRLGPAEQVLLPGRLALQQGRFADAERAFQEATRKFPDEVQAWMELAELYFHQNPLRSRSPQESADALQHVLVLDPLNTEAMLHLADLAVLNGERALAAKITDRLLALADDPLYVVTGRLTLAWGLGDSADRDKSIADLLKPGTSRSTMNSAFARLLWLREFDQAERLASAVAAAAVPEERALGLYMQAMVDLARGRAEAARTEIRLAAQLDPSSNAVSRGPWIDTLDFLPQTPVQLAAARAAVERIDVTRAEYLLPQKRYLAGVLAARAGDEVAATKNAGALEEMPPLDRSSITGDLALAIRARLRAASHDPAGAVALLERQALRIPARYVLFYPDVGESQLRAALLAELGRKREALDMYGALNIYSGVHPIFLAPSLLAKARLREQLNDDDRAAEDYAAFVKMWHDCEAAERPLIEQASKRLAELRHATERASR